MQRSRAAVDLTAAVTDALFMDTSTNATRSLHSRPNDHSRTVDHSQAVSPNAVPARYDAGPMLKARIAAIVAIVSLALPAPASAAPTKPGEGDAAAKELQPPPTTKADEAPAPKGPRVRTSVSVELAVKDVEADVRAATVSTLKARLEAHGFTVSPAATTLVRVAVGNADREAGTGYVANAVLSVPGDKSIELEVSCQCASALFLRQLDAALEEKMPAYSNALREANREPLPEPTVAPPGPTPSPRALPPDKYTMGWLGKTGVGVGVGLGGAALIAGAVLLGIGKARGETLADKNLVRVGVAELGFGGGVFLLGMVGLAIDVRNDKKWRKSLRPTASASRSSFGLGVSGAF